METTRQNKISRLLQKELSEIFLLQTKSMPGTLVSVSAVRISPDMSIARVYLSVFPSEKAEDIRAIRRLAGQVTLSLDPDPAGRQNTVRCAHMLLVIKLFFMMQLMMEPKYHH